jgi:Predicted Fe-S oxidoreductase
MFGLPDETDAQIRKTAEILSEQKVDGVKLHNLHVLRNTPLEKLYRESRFKPVDLEEYSRKVALFLENLSPKIAVHRLAAVASRWDELVAPQWTREKNEKPLNLLIIFWLRKKHGRDAVLRFKV